MWQAQHSVHYVVNSHYLNVYCALQVACLGPGAIVSGMYVPM